jgi:hypothetical protein
MTKEEEALDPSTSPERLRQLKSTMGIEVASNPNTPPDVLLELAEDFPAVVAKNPALEMLALESPSYHAKIQNEIMLRQAFFSVKSFAIKTWPKGFSVRSWGSEPLPPDALLVPSKRGLLSAYLFVVLNQTSKTIEIWAVPFDSGGGFVIGEVWDGQVILNEFGESLE